jgi:hypothetical protein
MLTAMLALDSTIASDNDCSSGVQQHKAGLVKAEQQACDGLQRDADAAIDVSSVITQVSTIPVVPQSKWLPQQEQEGEQQNGKGWRHRMRNLLCCLSPPTSGLYAKQDVQLISTYYQAMPPQPPRVYREAVIEAKKAEDMHKKTLVLDLDETLVHSSFKPIPNPDYIIPVEIDGRLVDVYVLKRPWLDHFMATVRCCYCCRSVVCLLGHAFGMSSTHSSSSLSRACAESHAAVVSQQLLTHRCNAHSSRSSRCICL